MGRVRNLVQAVATSNDSRVPSLAKKAVARLAPHQLFFAKPVMQIYCTDGAIDTLLCINDFLGVMAPGATIGTVGEVTLHDQEGTPVARQNVRLAPRSATALSASEMLAAAGHEDGIGLATVDLRPVFAPGADRSVFRRMGRITSHFYAFYQDATTGSIGIVHPQMTVQDAPHPTTYRSCQSVVLQGVDSIGLWQSNATSRAAQVRFDFMCSEDGALLTSRSVDVSSMGARSVVVWRDELPQETERVYFVGDGLPHANAKPLLLRRFTDGRFSISHS